jgi:hypothetical protein
MNNLVLDHVIKKMLPISYVTQPSFMAIVNSPFASKVMWSKVAFLEKINDRYSTMVQKLTGEIASIKYSCTSYDIWSSPNRSFLGKI